MKSFPFNLILLFVVLLVSTAWEPATKDQFIGTFRLIKATTNSQPNPSQTMDRLMTFTEENSFAGDINIPSKGNMPFNQGIYIVENEKQILMHHSDPNTKELYPIAFVYNYSFSGDTLRLNGFYFRQAMEIPNIMQKFFIDECWMRNK